MEKLILIDGNSLINRAFYAIPTLNAKDGSPTNAVYGFANMLIKLIETERPTKLAVVFDMRAPTFRHKRYDGYKATRKGMPDELASQLPKLKELLRLMNVTYLELEGYEADDIIGTLATKEPVETYIVTGDKDSLQLVSESTTVLLTKRGISETETYTPQYFREVYGFEPPRLVDLKSLMGDASDNIPGVPGVGEKTAMRLIRDYGTLEGVYDNLAAVTGALHDKLADNRAMAQLSYELATIDTNVPIAYDFDTLTYDYPFGAAVKNKFETYSFRSLLKKDIFTEDESTVVSRPNADMPEIIDITLDELNKLPLGEGFSFFETLDAMHLAIDGQKDYRIRIVGTLLEPGETSENIYAALAPFLADPRIEKTVFDYKTVKTALARSAIALENCVMDIRLSQYVCDCTVNNETIGSVLDAQYLSELSSAPAAALWRLRKLFEEELEAFRSVYYGIERPLSDVLYRMERRGWLVDTDVLDTLEREIGADVRRLEQEVQTHAGRAFNVKSPQQLAEVLFGELKLDSGKKTKSKFPSTSADILEGLRGVHPIIDAVLKFRFVSKLYGTYIEGIKKLLDEEHVVHTEFKQTVTTTGRLSSAEPNLQNIPMREEEGRKIRKMFIAREGYSLLSADYSQIELRLLAHFSDEESLIESYRHGVDIHRRTASDVFGVPLEEVTSQQRRDAKAVNFGVIYGISDFGLSRNIGISVAQAHKYISSYFFRYPKVKTYLDRCVEQAHKAGRLATLTGRVRKFPDINSSNFQLRSFNERAAMNFPLQGTAADLVKLAMVHVDEALRQQNLSAQLICQVHDELIIEAPDAEITLVKEILQREMETAMSLNVPLVAEVSVAKNWLDLK